MLHITYVIYMIFIFGLLAIYYVNFNHYVKVILTDRMLNGKAETNNIKMFSYFYIPIF